MTDTPQLTLTTTDGSAIQIVIRQTDGYVDATALCQVMNKEWKAYYKTQSTKLFLDEIAKGEGMLVVRQVTIVTPQNQAKNYLVELGKSRTAHTWIHPMVAIDLARWASPRYQAAVSKLVYKFQTGKITTEQSLAASHDLTQQVEMIVDQPLDYAPVRTDIVQHRVDAIHVTNAKNQIIKRVLPNSTPQDYAMLANASNQIAMNFTTSTSVYKKQNGIPSRYSIPDVVDEIGLSRRTIAEAGIGNYLIHCSEGFTGMPLVERKAAFQNHQRKIHAATDIINPRTPSLLPLPEVKKNKADVALQRKNGTVKPSLEARALLPLTLSREG